MALWDKITSSGEVEDRRGFSPIAGVGGGLGVVGTLVYLAFTFLASGGDVGSVLEQLQGVQVTQQNFQQSDYSFSKDYPVFASKVLGSNNDLWAKVFSESGQQYIPPKLVLFRAATTSGCGVADSQAGPHYCPADSTIYLDETFFDELQARFQAKGGDVAEAYVIAHEVGHHVQNELGLLQAASRQGSDSVNLELQADCLAGVWAHSVAAQGVFEPGEVGEALDAAAAVGDDRIQKTVTGRVNPETWTHGSSEQRVSWFNRGFESGDPGRCNTF